MPYVLYGVKYIDLASLCTFAGNLELLEMLVAHGADHLYQSPAGVRGGATALSLATERGHGSIVDFLTVCDGRRARNHSQGTSVGEGVGVSGASLSIGKGVGISTASLVADVSTDTPLVADVSNDTPLVGAIRHGNTKARQPFTHFRLYEVILLQRCLLPFTRIYRKMLRMLLTLTGLCEILGSQTVKQLLERRADPQQKHNGGMCALDIAKQQQPPVLPGMLDGQTMHPVKCPRILHLLLANVAGPKLSANHGQ